jgi:outer membrane receptor protein involved in Fe transport
MSAAVTRAFIASALCVAQTGFADTLLPAVTVTGTREQTLLSETPASVGVIDRGAIDFNRPSHPQQLLGQIPGVAIAVTNGEGHTTAIRQGFTTGPMYLFLEDGIPARATGNFNHNALYELNLPSAGGVEVVRGIGSALYGSDAIGGLVNVLSRTPRETAGADLSVEAGSFGWGRVLGGIDSGRRGPNALRADLNLTHTDGWRDSTAYDRQSLNLRWDHEYDSQTLVKTILGATHIDQQTGANSALPLGLYLNNPTVNLRSAAYREVDALRLSSAVEKDLGQGMQLSFTSYFRDNRMDLNGSYNFPTNARIEKTQVQSYGLMTKFRQNLNDKMRTRLIAGLDLDYSPSQRLEDKTTLLTDTVAGQTRYYSYVLGQRIYDYDVTYQSAAPYLHLELSPTDALRFTVGLRYDYASMSMQNNLGQNATVNSFYQLADTAVNFSRLSPKLGLTWAVNEFSHAFASYNQGFRTPSENQLFRSGATGLTAAAAAAALRPILAEQFEVGLRGEVQRWSYELVAYHLKKQDDLLAQRDSSGVTVQTNNGSTEHQGVEMGLGTEIAPRLRLDLAASYAKHRYRQWRTSIANYSGNEIENSPRLLANLRLTWQPVKGTQAQLEWVELGSYYLEASNLQGKYDGHRLFNARISTQLDRDWSCFARLVNLTDKRYADSASYASSMAMYSPGLPRAVYLGVQRTW